MSHQLEDVRSLEFHPRINVWNGLGTGKTCTVAWWLQRLWRTGVIDEAVVVIPSMLAPDWERTMYELAWPGELVEVYDLRPPHTSELEAMLTSKHGPTPGVFRVSLVTYAGLRMLLTGKEKRGRWAVKPDHPILVSARGRRIAAVFDEAQAASTQNTGQSEASRAFASACRAVAGMTATPIGNPLSMRLWGITSLVRPDILMRMPVGRVGNLPAGAPGSFNVFKHRYGVLVDPAFQKARRDGKPGRFVLSRAYPVDVNTEMIQREILGPMKPFTVMRRKEDCLDLPPKVYLTRYVELPSKAVNIMRSIIEDDRAVLESGRSIVPSNVLEERLRLIELVGGWIDGEPVHDAKLQVLRDVIAEIRDAEGERAPICIWASRSRELIAAGLVSAGITPSKALSMATDVYPPDSDNQVNPKAYDEAIQTCLKGHVGIIHGPTPLRERDRIQSAWKTGQFIRTVIAHPGVAGAGLNWQHAKATVYYGQPLGTIARQQSEDRVHRHGLKHKALYYDLVVQGGPDEAVARAHREQRDAADALLRWIADQSR